MKIVVQTKMKNKINIIILCFALLLLNGCTILLTEEIKKQSAKNKQKQDSVGYFVPNLNNMDSNFISIEAILAKHNISIQDTSQSVKVSVKTDTADINKNVFGLNLKRKQVTTTVTTTTKNNENSDTNSTNNYILSASNLDASYYPDSIIVNVVVQNESGEFVSGLATPYLTEGRKNSDF
jgi:hypothetical protein